MYMETDQKNPVFPDELPENSQNLTNHDDEIQTLAASDPINPNNRVSLGRDNTNEAIQAFPIYKNRGNRVTSVCNPGTTTYFDPLTNLIRVATHAMNPDAFPSNDVSRLFFEDNQSGLVTLIPGTVEYFTVTPGVRIFVTAVAGQKIYINS